jgi:hypothetical protein
MIDVILGPSNGVLTNITDTFPSTVTGSQLFPQSGYPFQPPGPTDQRGMILVLFLVGKIVDIWQVLVLE